MYKGMLLAALILCMALSVIRRKKLNLSVPRALVITVLLIMFGVLGAKILAIIESGGNTGGYSFFGALYFAPLGLYVTGKMLKIPAVKCVDFFGVYVPLILACLRVGCFIEGCCGANPIEIGSKTVTPPIQLIECGLDLLIFLFILIKYDRCFGKEKSLGLPVLGVSEESGAAVQVAVAEEDGSTALPVAGVSEESGAAVQVAVAEEDGSTVVPVSGGSKEGSAKALVAGVKKERSAAVPVSTYAVFAALYSFVRLVMENYRATEKNLAGMSEGQWLSILTFVVAFCILAFGKKAGADS